MTRVRAVLIGAGVLVMGYALAGALTDHDVKPFGVAIFLAAVLVGHDAVWMPLVLAAGALINRVVPARSRPVVRVAAVVAAVLSVAGVPLALGYGRPPDNPSALPLAYGRNLALVLGGLAVAALVGHFLRTGRRKDSESPGAPADE
jgi:hypothetical protein